MNSTKFFLMTLLQVIGLSTLQAQTDSTLRWIITPLSEIYPGKGTKLESHFFNPAGDEVFPEKIRYEVSHGKLTLLKKDNLLLINPAKNESLVIKAVQQGKVLGKVNLHIQYQPDFFLANAFGNKIEDMEHVPLEDFLQVRVAGEQAKSYQIKKLTLRLFRGGRSIAKREFNGHIMDLRSLNLKPGDGIQVKIEDVGLRKKTDQKVDLKIRLLSFFMNN